MKIKFTWGTGILITIILGLSFFISFIMFSLTQDVNLVSEDYFVKEIAYEGKLNRINNADKLSNKIYIKKEGSKIIIAYPKDKINSISGEILLFYVTSNRHDISIDIKPNENGKQIISTNNLKKGRYYVKIEWEANKIKYFQEFKITI